MQVFKVYFKIMRKHIKPLLLYFMLFVGISIMITNAFGGGSEGFTKTRSKIALFNDDAGQVLADGLSEYIADNATIVMVRDNEQSIQDALFYGNISYAFRIPEGFSRAFMAGSASAVLEKIEGPNALDNVQMDLLVMRYMNIAAIYVANLPGADGAQIAGSIASNLATGAELGMHDYSGSQNEIHTALYYKYLAYAIMAIIMMGVTSFMMTMNSQDLSNRNLCSPVKHLDMNLQMVLGNAVFAILVWAALCATVFIINKGIPQGIGTLLLCLNALALIIVSLSIGFLAGKFVKSFGVQNAVVNIVSLGSSFLCGVFVQQELLGETVLNIARFLPAYWYVKAVDDIRNIGSFSYENILPVVYSMLIQLGFAAVIFIVALVLTKQKRLQRQA